VDSEFLECAETNENFLKKHAITSDETCVYGYDPKLSNGHHQCDNNFDYKGVVHHDYVPQDHTTTNIYIYKC
jgi:hypothetical protein